MLFYTKLGAEIDGCILFIPKTSKQNIKILQHHQHYHRVRRRGSLALPLNILSFFLQEGKKYGSESFLQTFFSVFDVTVAKATFLLCFLFKNGSSIHIYEIIRSFGLGQKLQKNLSKKSGLCPSDSKCKLMQRNLFVLTFWLKEQKMIYIWVILSFHCMC